MFQGTRAIFRLTAGFLFLALQFSGSGGSSAQSAPVDHVVGLRAGMSYGEVVALLEKRDDVELVETAEQWVRESQGIPTRQLVRAVNGITCAANEKTTRDGWHSVCDTMRGRFQARKEVTNEIVVAFTGMPESERAGSLWRRNVFPEGKSPTVADLIAALTEKYGTPHIRQTESGYYSLSHRRGATNLNWVYTPDGRPIEGNDSLRSRCVNGPKPWFATEHSWNGACGLTIRAEILPVPGSGLLVRELNVSVVHQSSFIEQLHRFDAELKAAVQQRAQATASKPDL